MGRNGQKAVNPVTYTSNITAEDVKNTSTLWPVLKWKVVGPLPKRQRKAAAYIENYFKQLGLAPGVNGGYQQPYPVFRIHS